MTPRTSKKQRKKRVAPTKSDTLDKPNIEWRFLYHPEYAGKKWGVPEIYATPRSLESLVRETCQNSLDATPTDVTVRYRLFELSPKSARYKKFLNALGYPNGLSEHIRSAIEAAGKRDIAIRLKEGLDIISRRLRVLCIEDFGARGLAGDEFSSGSAFAALVRDTSNSEKEDQFAGGSYGLGSSTLFGSSKIMTVVFASVIKGQEDKGVRLIAKSELSYHTAGKKAYMGTGWLGSPVGKDGIHSVYLPSNAIRLKDLLADRPLPAGEKRITGTSAIIACFSEAKADDMAGDEVAEAFVKAIAVNFWPALVTKRLKAEVQFYEDDAAGPTYSRIVKAEEWVPSLVDAFRKHLDNEIVEKLETPGDTVSIPIELHVPATTPDGGVEPQHPNTVAECRLIVRLAENEVVDKDQQDSVGFTRGRGMITQYISKRNLAAGARSYHAVLLAGTLAGHGKPEEAAERFLRFSEPPAHNDWDASNLGGRYVRGGGKRLTEFYQRVVEALRKVVSAEPEESTEGPDVLKEILKLKKLPSEPQPSIRILAAQASLTGNEYHVSATLMPDRHGTVTVSPRLSIMKESGQAIKGEWKSLQSKDAAVVGESLRATGKTKIQFTGVATFDVPGLDLSRCAVTISASYARDDE